MVVFKRITSMAVVAAITILLSACESSPLLDKYNPPIVDENVHGEIITVNNRIALLSIEEPLVYDIRIMESGLPSSPGVTMPGRIMGKGMVTMMKTMEQGQKNQILTSTLDFWKFKISEHLEDDITRELEKLGYKVEIIVPKYRRRARFVTMDDIPESSKPVDAIVDVYVKFAGYVAGREQMPYMPTLEVPFKVIASATNEVVHQGILTYGGPISVTGPSDMPADPAHNVRGFDTLCATDCEVSPAVQGLTAASEGVATLLINHVK